MTRDDVRDAVIDWMFAAFPCLLQDDHLVEGFVFFAHQLWAEAEREERRKRVEALARPRTFELN